MFISRTGGRVRGTVNSLGAQPNKGLYMWIIAGISAVAAVIIGVAFVKAFPER